MTHLRRMSALFHVPSMTASPRCGCILDPSPSPAMCREAKSSPDTKDHPRDRREERGRPGAKAPSYPSTQAPGRGRGCSAGRRSQADRRAQAVRGCSAAQAPSHASAQGRRDGGPRGRAHPRPRVPAARAAKAPARPCSAREPRLPRQSRQPRWPQPAGSQPAVPEQQASRPPWQQQRRTGHRGAQAVPRDALVHARRRAARARRRPGRRVRWREEGPARRGRLRCLCARGGLPRRRGRA